MIRLLKKDKKRLNYWEVWYEEDEQLIKVHFGCVGEHGDHYAIVVNRADGHPFEIMRKWADQMKEQGFQELTANDLSDITVEFLDVNEADGDSSLEKRYLLEHLFDQCLGQTGNGHCDGADYGRGGLVVLCRVIDVDKAVEMIIHALSQVQMLDHVAIATAKNGTYIPLYPRLEKWDYLTS